MKTFLALVIVLALSLGVISSMSAQIPRTLSYQGVLTDTSGTPKPDGRYYFTFKLYDSGGPTGWSQAESLDVKRGLFYTTLGKEPNPFPSSLRFDRPYWLGIQVGSQPELPQRIPLTSVGYSLNSFRADSSSWSRRSDTASYAQSPARPISPPISTPEIANAAVDSTKLAANSVTSAKILDGTIQRVDVSPSFKAPAADTSDFARNVVIAVGSIDSTKLATNSVTSSKILDGTILNADISANAAISQSKIDNSVRAINADKVDGFDASATPTANMLLPLDNTAKFPVSALPSAGGDVSGSLNSLTVTGLRGTGVSPSTPLINQVLQYNGSQWVPASISVGGITSINSQTGPSISITSGSGISISTPTTNNIQISNTGVSSVTASPPLNSSGGTNPTISLSSGGITDAHISATANIAASKIAGTALTSTTGIQNQGSSAQSNSNFWISGTGRAASLQAGSLTSTWNAAVAGEGSTITGIFGKSSSGFGGEFTSSSASAVYALSTNWLGIYGYSTSNWGGQFSGVPYGVVGFSRSTSGLRAGGYFDASTGQSYAYVGAVTAAGTVRKIEGIGTVNTVMKTREGMKSLFAPEMPEAWFEDIGRGELLNGHARIELDPLFLDCITVNENMPMNVFIQLNDDCNGVYVKSDRTGFDVYELKGGTSSAKFTYRVMAKWKGYENERFPVALPPLNPVEGQ